MLKNLRTLRKYYRRFWGRTLLGVLALLFCDAFETSVPFLTGLAVDALRGLQNRGEIGTLRGMLDLRAYTPLTGMTLLALALVLAQALRAAFSYLQRTLIIRSSRHIENDLRVDFFAHLQKLSPSYYDRTKTGDLMALSINDLGAVRNATGPGVMMAFSTIFTIIYSLTVMLLTDPRLTLFGLAPLLLLPALVKGFSGPIRRRFEKIQEQFATISTACQENFSGIRVVKAFVREEHEKAKFRAMNEDYAQKNISLMKIRAVYHPLLFALAGVSITLIYWLGGREHMAGRISIGQLFMFDQYIGLLIWPMMALGWVLVMFQQADTSMGRINKVFEAQPTIGDDGARPIENFRGEILFRNLTFTYPGCERPALAEINLKVPAGSTLAVVGPAGAGKSTLARLIARLYEVGRGQLFIDGRDVTTVPLHQLREIIGYVPQETFLFSESIRENIAYGAPDAPEDAVLAAAEIAQIHGEIAQLKEGYNQMLGERGINLSGGQKQRTAIARAVIKNPGILILDDALSSVDTHTEESILGHLKGVMRRRTSIMISHRLSSIRHADNIVVLEDGRVTEQGAHEELMRNGGFYAMTYIRQQLEESLREM